MIAFSLQTLLDSIQLLQYTHRHVRQGLTSTSTYPIYFLSRCLQDKNQSRYKNCIKYNITLTYPSQLKVFRGQQCIIPRGQASHWPGARQSYAVALAELQILCNYLVSFCTHICQFPLKQFSFDRLNIYII